MSVKIQSLRVVTLFASLVFTSQVLAGDVGYKDLREESSAKVIELSPVYASKGRTAIIAFGGNDKVLNAVYQAAKYVARELDEDIMFFTAPDNDKSPTITVFHMYSNGVKSGEIISGSENAKADRLIADLKDVVLSARRVMSE